MSLLGQLKPKRGSTHRRKLLGRGDATGRGSTAGKGHKGQKARKGAPIRRGFEGGQTPLARRSPKFGFKNTAFRTRYEIINISQLEGLSGEVTPDSLRAKGWVGRGPVKVLAKGKLSKALTVKAHQFSEAAKAAIESAGGKAEVIA